MAQEENTTPGEQYQLLVVDDTDGIRDVLEIQLTRAGYAVTLAENARQALDRISADDYDLILLDIKLPDMNGIDLLTRLRESRSILDTPIIVISGLGQTADVVAALRNGANDHVTKPFDLAVVLARIKTQLSLKRLKQINDRFLKIASHDLKKPLLLILDAARQLRGEFSPGRPMAEDGKGTLDLIIESGEYMRRIIEELLELRAIRDGGVRLAKAPADLNAIARQAVERNAAYAKSKGIEIQARLEPGLPQIRADDFQLMQVLDNLLGNAIKFSPAGSRATVRTHSTDGYVVCEVSDTGPGITDADMKKLFVEYAKLSNVPTGNEMSTGLGLSICKELVLLHGGDIGARNNPGGGVTFQFRLPLE